MEVTLELRNWKVIRDEKTKQPKICGAYELHTPLGVAAADQKFNEGYNEKEISFSPELVKKVSELETLIRDEIQGIFSRKL